VCPSCNSRRMVATAAHLTDHVLPDLPVRQWVLAVPKRLRYFLHRDADLQGAALRLFLRVVERHLRAHSPGSGPAARLGAVAFIHRFGSTLNAHLHFHLVIDGVFDRAAGGVVFHAATGVEANAIADVQAGVRRRCCGLSCAAACCRAMTPARWRNGHMAAGFPSRARCASRLLTVPDASVCCVTAPGRRSPWNGCANSTRSASSTTPRSEAPAAAARSSCPRPPARAWSPWRPRPPESATTQACGAARCRRKSTLDPPRRRLHTQPRALEMTIR